MAGVMQVDLVLTETAQPKTKQIRRAKVGNMLLVLSEIGGRYYVGVRYYVGGRIATMEYIEVYDSLPEAYRQWCLGVLDAAR